MSLVKKCKQKFIFTTMRKYQQLILVVISLLSITILLIYKSENNRLKYVLQVVNFFGRNEAAVLSRLENGTKLISQDFSNPLPVWQRISDNFYIYTAFWSSGNAIDGGEATALIVAKEGAIINFKCAFRLENDTKIQGNFVFMPIKFEKDTQKQVEHFVILKFICHTTKNLAPITSKFTPSSLILMDMKTGAEQETILRRVGSEHPPKASPVAACLNLASQGVGTLSKQFLHRNNLMQFFMHHQIIGIEDFLVYNSDFLSLDVKKLLTKLGIRVHYFPFNFPFPGKSNAARALIEMDCLMRTSGVTKFAILLGPSEYFYPNINIKFRHSVVSSLAHYTDNINRFELPVFSVCLDHKNKLLIDNNFYEPEYKVGHKIYIGKSTLNPENADSIALPVSRAFAHNYINCVSSKDLLYDWRSSVREDFMQYIQTVRNEISFIF